MSKPIRVRGVRRKQVDTEQLAMAFLLLAKALHEQKQAADAEPSPERRTGADRSTS